MGKRVWLLLVIFVGFINGGLSEEHQKLTNQKRSSAVVVGTVYCDSCSNDVSSKSHSHFMSGASVAVECIDGKSKPGRFRQEVKTDEKGRFMVKLPFYVGKHVKNIKRCSVQLLTSSQPYCSVASSASSSSFRLVKTRNRETRLFSAGFVTFKPEMCSHKPIGLENSKASLPDPAFPPPIQDPSLPDPLLPDPSSPLPSLPPLPLLPPLPSLPPLLPPLPPNPASLQDKEAGSLEDKKTDGRPDFFLPPLPLLPPPSILPPNPLLPTPPAPLLPPLPPVPSLPLPPVPGIPVPGLNPPPSAPPSLPIPLPPIFPGVPPASPSSSPP